MMAPCKAAGLASITTTAEGTATTTGTDPGLDAGTEAAPTTAMTVISGTPSALAEEVTPPTEVEAR